MSKQAKRLERIVENDGSGEIKRTLTVMQSDLATLLSEFAELNRLNVVAERTADGYDLNIAAKVNRFYGVGMSTDE